MRGSASSTLQSQRVDSDQTFKLVLLRACWVNQSFGCWFGPT